MRHSGRHQHRAGSTYSDCVLSLGPLMGQHSFHFKKLLLFKQNRGVGSVRRIKGQKARHPQGHNTSQASLIIPCRC
ncbi:hypothetical protein SRHO_G00095020 [Serrasalmus rhombeus]